MVFGFKKKNNSKELEQLKMKLKQEEKKAAIRAELEETKARLREVKSRGKRVTFATTSKQILKGGRAAGRFLSNTQLAADFGVEKPRSRSKRRR